MIDVERPFVKAPRSPFEAKLLRLGLRQRDVVRLARTSRAYISDCVRGRRSPSGRVLLAISRLEELIEGRR